MATRKLEKNTWRVYFDWLSRQLPALRAEIEVSDLDLGSQVSADQVLIDGISYDPYDKEVVITSERFEHHIEDPQEIYVIEDAGQLSAFEVIDREGKKQIVRLTPLGTLPVPPPV